jgi:polyhydroxyalkanoate synthesis regulator phasin
MFFKEDNTYQEICERSVMQWLEEMKQHEDLAVRGGVKVTTDYILRLKKQIEVLEEKNQLKDEYMRKLKDKG